MPVFGWPCVVFIARATEVATEHLARTIRTLLDEGTAKSLAVKLNTALAVADVLETSEVEG